MSDKYNLEEELNQRELEQDKEKETAIFKHLADIGVMDKLVFALNEYIIKFGRTSNVHDQCFDLKLQVLENKKHLQEWIDKI
ncbi:hypothetical protein [uncultured Mediterranean phage uvMED]|nr:hypothetical protein [uncultured Mediterranean phage uvMED]BAQ91713.1 hypothetical protein [uncultured Mediterranean phage uvMED]BAQ91766.1 hypothetical protein [uncultured Mediterranean phage uvMED]BAQ91813.1 hypothetical protein [uncultured Mediterranean phage uvMED]BAR20461.1 hypothetical protein [uncultured Mediterranean phage uvMED]